MIHRLQKVGPGQQLQSSPKAGFGSGSASPGAEIEFLHPAAAANAGLILKIISSSCNAQESALVLLAHGYLVLKVFGW